MKSKERFIWDIVNEILESRGETVDDISIHESGDSIDESYKIYCSDGYCFELEKQSHCEPDELDDYSDIHALESDGCTYHFSEPWDGFKEAGIDKAIEILNQYAGLTND